MSAKGMTAVREAEGLRIDVSELLRDPGSQRRIAVTEEVPGLAQDLAQVAGPATLDLLAESLVEGILVTGTLAGTLQTECRRCLEDAAQDFSTPVEELFLRGPGDEDRYGLEDEILDLEPMVRDAVVLAMPLHPLCRPDCRGLCPECGQNLNESDCGHRPERTDVRWEPLRRLRETMGE